MAGEAGNGDRPPPRYTGMIAAVLLLLCSGAGYRYTRARLDPVHGEAHIVPGVLTKLPMEIGDWRGSDIPLSAELVRATDTDELVSRMYTSPSSPQDVSLYVGFGVRLRDLMPHRPEVCYPGAGWTLEQTDPVSVPLADGTPLECQVHHFERTGLGSTRMTVLNYYVVDDRYVPDVELLRSKAWRFTTDVRYMAQVQIACGDRLARGHCDEAARAFAAVSAPLIRKQLAAAVDAPLSGS